MYFSRKNLYLCVIYREKYKYLLYITIYAKLINGYKLLQFGTFVPKRAYKYLKSVCFKMLIFLENNAPKVKCDKEIWKIIYILVKIIFKCKVF